MKSFKLSPSDLTFLWDECPRCFYLKVALGFNRPPGAFPMVFSRIDQLMKHLFMGKPSAVISPDLPPGEVTHQGKWVNSAPIQFDDLPVSGYIRGAFDTLLTFEDGTYGVVDFKTSRPLASHAAFYGRQLNAYAYALEHAAPKALHLAPVSKMGLLYLDPVDIDHGTDHRRIVYGGEVTWKEIPRDEEKFLQFMRQVLTLLAREDPPPPAPNCEYCKYRDSARQTGW